MCAFSNVGGMLDRRRRDKAKGKRRGLALGVWRLGRRLCVDAVNVNGPSVGRNLFIGRALGLASDVCTLFALMDDGGLWQIGYGDGYGNEMEVVLKVGFSFFQMMGKNNNKSSEYLNLFHVLNPIV